jgi:hypothetical protein
MTTPVAANVLVGKPPVTGGLLYAPIGTTVPTDATTSLPGAFVGVGYIHSDGVVQAMGTDSSDITAWGGDVVRTIQTSHTLTYHFTMLETNDQTLAAYYGDDNFDPGVVRINSAELPHKEWVIAVLDDDRTVRVVVPNGKITERGDLGFVTDDAAGYEVTVTCYPDASGNKAYIYYSDTGAGADVPVITTLSQATTVAAGGALITITGHDFTGVTGAAAVKFGATNATNYVLVSDYKIVATAPAHAAGSAPVTVTTPEGTSNAFPFSYT